MHMPTKKYLRKIMFNGSNCDRKSQLTEILTEPLNPCGLSHEQNYFKKSYYALQLEITTAIISEFQT